MIIHKCENEHKCRSVRDDESDSENVRLWLCRTDVDAEVDDGVDVVDEFVVDEFAVVVAVIVVLEDEFAAVDVRLFSIFIKNLFSLSFCSFLHAEIFINLK